MGAKRLIPVLFVLVVVGGFFFFRGGESRKVLRVYSWSNYFPEDMLKKFTQQSGYAVELSFLSSNEELLAKLRAGAKGYDVIQPSDYMVGQMKKLGMLSELDHAKLPNLKHLDPRFHDAAYDPGQKLSVPFTWGTTGIAVNTAKVKVPADGISWTFLTASPEPRRTSLLDDMRECFSIVLMLRGLDINTKDRAQLEKAREDITAVKNKILMFISEPKALMLKEELYVSHMFSADAAQAHAEKPEIQYFIPKEGGITWTDNFAIPKTAPNPEAAHAFINFILEPENAVKIVRERQLATPNLTARAMLTPEERENPYLYPSPEIMKRLRYLEDVGETLTVINRLWTELKS